MRKPWVYMVVLLGHLLSLALVVEGKKRKQNRQKKGSADHSVGIYMCLFIFCLSFIPSLIYFVYSVIKDPLTPTLVANATKLFGEKTTGYLSARKKGKKAA
jgi:hypothetical protein